VIFLRNFYFWKKKFKHILFNMGYQRPSNGEYIAGEKDFLDTPGAQGSHPKTGLSNIGKTHFYP
jgi:hypothetical protein